MLAFVASIRDGDITTARARLAAEPELAQAHDGSGVSAILVAIYYGHQDFAREIAEEKSGLDLFEVAALGDLNKLAARASGDLNATSSDGFTALGLAAYFGHLEVAAWLLEQGANPNIPSRNPLGVTPLHSALSGQHEGIVRLLVQAGADVNAASAAGWTPLRYVAEGNHVALAELLLSTGAVDRDAAKVAMGKGFADLAKKLDVLSH